MKRKVCVYTSTRAEYGLLRSVMQEIQSAESLQLQIIASGAHLSQEFGMTVKEIQADGFEPDEAIEILLSSDTPPAICKSMSLAMICYGEALQRLKPDIVLLLGDRFETFCMAAAAQVCRVPLAHIHGGETTEGAVDEAFRHSITKMSHLHFASCELYRRRIIQLGEDPANVFNVGSLGVENIRKMSLLDRDTLGDTIRFDFNKRYFLSTFHPVTLEKDTAEGQIRSLLKALDVFPEYNVIFTKANADTDGRIINRMIDEYAEKHSERCFATASLGVHRYLSVMKYATLIIGNSSSAIIEAPMFKIPTVNIGDRQKGRLMAGSIINCDPDFKSIRQAIDHALSPAFQKGLLSVSNPYERPGTCSAIVELLEKININGITKKKFNDIEFN